MNIFKGYKAYIFDLDGTLCDTSVDLCNSVNYALEKNGFAKRNLFEVKSYLGNGIKTLMELSSGLSREDVDFDVLFSDFKDYYSKHLCDYTRPYEHIDEILDVLNANGAIVCVLSNKIDEYVKIICDKYFQGKLKCTLGERPDIPRKPAPNMVEKIAKCTQVDKKDMLYIGDSEVDMHTARNSGIDYVLVSWGFRNYDYLDKLGKHTILKSTKELLKYLS